ncbi:inteferon-activable protein 208-like isoform X2 [Bos javanicus]|uniref:inteferon-activable protein 208-like isoform X2 n=1 Tax=Bos javanicus TaxID=9906 RepID=UPI002AA602DB|nr:inteferon-activable protein 208-like isoform X2 [Bos javanicus]
MVLSLQMERKSGFPFTMSVTKRDPETRLPWEVMKLTRRVSSMTLEQPMRKRHHLNPYRTWAQMRNMTRQAEQTLKSTGTPMTPDKLFLAMLAVLSCSSGDTEVSTQDSVPPTMESN